MIVERNVPLQPHNSFGIVAKARALVRVRAAADVQQLLADAEWGPIPKFVLGGGSNIVLTGDVKPLVLKVEVPGRRVLDDGPRATVLEAGAGENWHEFVDWTLEQGFGGLENLALIPGTVGASPVQNIGAYGVELQDRFESLDAIDLVTGREFTLEAGQCAFGYRDSVFKHVAAQEGDFGLAGRGLILRVRFRLPRPWKPVLGYLDLERKLQESGIREPSARQIRDWVCAIRSAKLPDPRVIGNAGSFFKNPVVAAEACVRLLAAHPAMPHYPQPDGGEKLAAGWLIEQAGWKGRDLGPVGCYERQALVLVNRGGASGADVRRIADAIMADVERAFGVRLEPEPVFV